ncbi:MAG: hypothetical protein IJW25_03480 [Clostridia bacterium]|nr:hypothetical protein [Clostridia bacterium]
MLFNSANVKLEDAVDHTFKDNLLIYKAAFENTGLKNVKKIGGKETIFFRALYVLKYYLSKENNGKFDKETVSQLLNIKNILDVNTEIKSFGVKSAYGVKKFYVFTKFNIPRNIQKIINEKYKNVLKLKDKSREL